jgi:hypothetical protein
MADLPNPTIALVPAESLAPGAEWPVLDPITTFDLVGPNAANRQPTSLKTRSITARDRMNKLIENSNYIESGGPASGAAYLPRDGSENMSGTLKLYDDVGAGATKHKLIFYVDDQYMVSESDGDGIDMNVCSATSTKKFRIGGTDSGATYNTEFYFEIDAGSDVTGIFRVVGGNKIEFGNTEAYVNRTNGTDALNIINTGATGVTGDLNVHAGTMLDLRADTGALGTVGIDIYSGGTQLVEARVGAGASAPQGWHFTYAAIMNDNTKLHFGTAQTSVYMEWITTPVAVDYEIYGLNVIDRNGNANIAASNYLRLGADADAIYLGRWSAGVFTTLAGTGAVGIWDYSFVVHDDLAIEGSAARIFWTTTGADQNKHIELLDLGTGTPGLQYESSDGHQFTDAVSNVYFTCLPSGVAGYLQGTTFESALSM